MSLVQKQIEDFRNSLNLAYFTPIADKAAGQQVLPLQSKIDALSAQVSTIQGTLATDMRNVTDKVGNVVEMGELQSDINEVWNRLRDVQDVDLVEFHRRLRFLETGQFDRDTHIATLSSSVNELCAWRGCLDQDAGNTAALSASINELLVWKETTKFAPADMAEMIEAALRKWSESRNGRPMEAWECEFRVKSLEEWRRKFGEVDDGERRIQVLIQKELEAMDTIRSTSKHSVGNASSADSGDIGTLYLGFQKNNGARTWCCATDHAEEARLHRNGWNPKFHTSSRREVLEWVSQEVLASTQGHRNDDIPVNIDGNNEAEASVAPSMADSKLSVDPPASEDADGDNIAAQATTQQDRWHATQAL